MVKKKKSIAFLVVEIVIVLAIVAGTILLLSKSINRAVYSERQQLLLLVTDTAANIVNEDIAAEWRVNDIIRKFVVNSIRGETNIEQRLSEITAQYDRDDIVFLVDDAGMYYSSDGHFGKLTDRSYYTKSTPDKMEYLGTLPHMDPENTKLILRERLEEPVTVQTERGEEKIVYYSCAHDMSELRDKVAHLYPGASNIFINDSDGAMLYKEFGIRLLIEGYNGYAKFARAEMPFGEDPDEIVQRLKNKESLVFNMRIRGEDFFFCSAPLNVADWALAMVIYESDINSMNGNAMPRIITYISIIVVVLGAALLFVVIFAMNRKRDQERIAASEQLAAAMSEASKAKTDFLSNMSHDIRTPINGIMGMTTIAKSVEGNPEKTVECLDKIDGASHHLLSLINDVLDMSRIERGKTKITTAPSDIRTICDNCCSIIGGQFDDRDIEFIREYDVEHPKVYADELHLRQVFINILGNAIKFTRDGGKIWFLCDEINCTDDEVTYRFTFRDTGIGMSKEFQTKIFEAFAQEESADRAKYKGTGLGMAITKQFVDLMHGTIEVESEIEKGSTFTITITFDRDKEERAAAELHLSDLSIDGVRILLAEDNDLNMEIATELLEKEGAVITPALDGEEALTKFSENEPGTYDVILMDIMMPNMNGLEATKAIRALDREDAKKIPIIAMTANAFDDDVRATREAGMNEHLSKPINVQDVIRTVSYFIKEKGERS